MHTYRALVAFGVAITLAPAARAGDAAGAHWPQWRGPALDGTSAATDVPLKWSESENVLWKVPLPAWGGATPIVWGEHVFVTSPSAGGDDAGTVGQRLPAQMGGREQPGGKELLLLCFDTRDGKLRWQQRLDDRNALYGKQNMSSPSPVTDGKLVWALTGTGVLTAFDFEGRQKWRIDLQEKYGQFGLLWGYASSPLLHEGTVVVQVLRGMKTRDPAYLIGFDGASGEVRWRSERTTDAQGECPDAYTTPTLWRGRERTDLIVSGADYVTGHDPASGREIWRAGGLNPDRAKNYRVCPSPTVVGDVILAPTRVKPMLALRAGGSGDVSASHLLWKLEKGGPDVPTPVSDGRLVYVVNDKGLVTCVDIKSGEVAWGPARTAVGTVSASPVLAAGRLYITNESGVTTVLAARNEHEELAVNTLEAGYTIASPAIVDRRIYLRGATHLYCIGR